MRQSRIVNITGDEVLEMTVPAIGTQIRTVPHERFYSAFRDIKIDAAVLERAGRYQQHATEIVEPSREDIVEAAKTYYVLKDIVESEEADAVMMNCLPGLQRPHKHVPPCMGFMDLRDEGIPAGCESDLDATLTLLLLQYLFDRPGFQHNPSVDTVRNHYFCAHCTSASKMNGPKGPAEPYVLRNHAEAGWGCVPRVLFTPNTDVTITKYLSAKSDATPQMLIYSGTLLGCPPIPPTGGCRTNAEATINELEDISQLKGHHLCLVYGHYAEQLRAFCQLHGIEAMT
jgi:L-fucose isomerase-like protein